MTATLNPQQRAAVRYIDGPLLVLAGAGSGKTAVITQKIAWLIKDAGFAPGAIAAVTFTNKAAREMRARVGALLNGTPKGLWVSTFHLLGLRILRADGARLGYRGAPAIWDQDDCLGLIRELGRKHKLRPEQAEAVQWRISSWKAALYVPGATPLDDALAPLAAKLYVDYQAHLQAHNAVDFDDLILQPTRLLRDDSAARAQWQDRLRYLLVDEYQDTNGAQYALVKLLVGDRGALTAVGDDDQSIYGWRGAQAENLSLLQRDFPTLKLVKLEQNYRSHGRILKAANALIANNPHAFEKHLWSALGFGDPITILRARDEQHEAEAVVTRLLHHRFMHRTALRDYAVLYRGNHQSRPFERALRERRIAYHLSGGTSFFERSEVKDLLAYLRLIANPDDDAAFLRVVNVPRREIGPVTLEKLAQAATAHETSLYGTAMLRETGGAVGERALANLRRFCLWLDELREAAATQSAPAVMKKLLADTRYETWLKDSAGDDKAAERKLENVKELCQWVAQVAARESQEGFADVVAAVVLKGILEREDDEPSSDCVSLMTLHAAKGLEFPHVYLVGIEEDLLPHKSSIAEDNIAEERRLAYVGITRAKQTLTLSFAKTRTRFGEKIDCAPSRFIAELPAEDLHWEGAHTDPQTQQAHGIGQLDSLRKMLKS